MVETYCTNYEIYKLAYEEIKENEIQAILETISGLANLDKILPFPFEYV